MSQEKYVNWFCSNYLPKTAKEIVEGFEQESRHCRTLVERSELKSKIPVLQGLLEPESTDEWSARSDDLHGQVLREVKSGSVYLLEEVRKEVEVLDLFVEAACEEINTVIDQKLGTKWKSPFRRFDNDGGAVLVTLLEAGTLAALMGDIEQEVEDNYSQLYQPAWDEYAGKVSLLSVWKEYSRNTGRWSKTVVGQEDGKIKLDPGSAHENNCYDFLDSLRNLFAIMNEHVDKADEYAREKAFENMVGSVRSLAKSRAESYIAKFNKQLQKGVQEHGLAGTDESSLDSLSLDDGKQALADSSHGERGSHTNSYDGLGKSRKNPWG